MRAFKRCKQLISKPNLISRYLSLVIALLISTQGGTFHIVHPLNSTSSGSGFPAGCQVEHQEGGSVRFSMILKCGQTWHLGETWELNRDSGYKYNRNYVRYYPWHTPSIGLGIAISTAWTEGAAKDQLADELTNPKGSARSLIIR